MSVWKDDPFEVLVVEEEPGEFASLTRREVAAAAPSAASGAVLARFDGFDLSDRPLVSGVPDAPGEVLVARATVALRHDQIGSIVVLLFERNDPRLPIVMGVIDQRGGTGRHDPAPAPSAVSVQVDDDRMVLTAEREIVLRCGHASLTLTRAGKVLIKGTYVLSRSSGYNKIKGAAVDIN